jgi:transcriptional regulator with XRE-family HTH domain
MSQSGSDEMTPEASAHVGRRLAAARLQRGLAQGDVAQRCGLAASYLSRIENGKIQPAFRTVMQIVGVLGADMSEIVGPDLPGKRPHGPCPVTAGRCLLDMIAAEADHEHYSPREVRLLRRFAAWLKSAEPSRVRAIEVLLDDLMRAADEEPA